MAQYFKKMPLWVIGLAKVIRDTLVTMTALSIFANESTVALVLICVREVVGAFVKYSDELPKSVKNANNV